MKYGENHIVALKTDGTLWTWGDNSNGQLGSGNTIGTTLPTQRGANNNWKTISAGFDYTIGIKTDGTIWAWGLNHRGQLGIGSTTDKLVPTQIGTQTNWNSISCGALHVLAIKNDGTLWAWGDNYDGRLGINSTATRRLNPTQVGTDTNWKQVSANSHYSMGVKTDGTLWVWGSRNIGNGYSSGPSHISPVQVGTDSNWTSCSTGVENFFAIKNDGTLWGWGDNYLGVLGVGSYPTPYIISQIGTDSNWKEISSAQASVAIKTNGTMWAWGDNYSGQHGNGTFTSASIPTMIGTSTNWTSASTYNGRTLALKSDTSAWTCGYGLPPVYPPNSPNFISVYCTTLSIADLEDISNIKIFPNPVSDFLNISFNEKIINATIYDIEGREILSFKSDNITLIDLKNLTDGIYYINLKTDDGEIIKKIIKK